MSEIAATSGATAQQVHSAVRDLSQRVRAWWHTQGLGHTSEIRFTENGSLEVKFSCMLGLHVDVLAYEEDESVPEAQRRALVIQRFRDRGLVLLDSPNEDLAVVDCDTSNEALRQQLKTTFPSCVVRSFESRGTRNGTFVLSTVHCLVRDLADVYTLPISTETF